MKQQAFFYDITLRDGNQALKKPWNTAQKEIVFKQLLKLGVQGIEVGFSGASDMDFEACQHLAKIAPKDVVISGLARAMKSDILKVYEAIKIAPKPRIHTFIAFSPFSMEFVLKKKPQDVQQIAVDAVSYAKSLLGDRGEVQFSAEHFGDSVDNLDFVIESLQRVVEAGATIINLPNTVERTYPSAFAAMVKKVVDALPKSITVSVHNHNDLGMATATTVESYFAGATQLECSLNGLGERAGNTNLYEVALTLHQNGIETGLNLDKIYETSILLSEMSGVAIYEKSPLIGSDALAHRSGIHQDGTVKTKHMKKGAYRAYDPSVIGITRGEHIGFTSQSGKTAIYDIVSSKDWPISIEEAAYLQPIMKKVAEEKGELPAELVIELYKENLFNTTGPYSFIEIKLVSGDPATKTYKLRYQYDQEQLEATATGDGPIDACLSIFKKDQALSLAGYEQKAIGSGSNALALTSIKLINNETKKKVIARGLDADTSNANIKAIFNGLNLLHTNS
jgi:2-isopropylmalate synthase